MPNPISQSLKESLAANPEIGRPTAFRPDCTVTDPNLAACLMAVGIPLVPSQEISVVSGDSQYLGFHFLPVSEDGLTWEECAKAWKQGADFIKANPVHPMSYAMATLGNRKQLDEYLRKAIPKVCIKRGSSVAVVDPTTSKEITDQILAKIGQ